MSFSHRIRMRLIRRVALGLAVAAVVAPSALAIDPALLPQQSPETSAYGELHQFPNAGLDQANPGPAFVRAIPAVAVDIAARSINAEPLPSMGIVPTPGIVPALPAYSVDGPRTGPATNLPVFSVDAPRSGPANVTETPLVIGSRFGRPDLAPNTGSSDVEIAWPEVGTGLGIGIAVALGIAALGMGMTRRRGTLQGA
jgi:hypothetical protein